jgi:microsomal epoxide hydrolase
MLSVNMIAYTKSEPDEAKLTDFEKKALEKVAHWRQNGMAYGSEHGTRPATIGHVLSSSPLALLAW